MVVEVVIVVLGGVIGVGVGVCGGSVVVGDRFGDGVDKLENGSGSGCVGDMIVVFNHRSLILSYKLITQDVPTMPIKLFHLVKESRLSFFNMLLFKKKHEGVRWRWGGSEI